MKLFFHTKKGRIYKLTNIITLLVLTFNMSFSGVFFSVIQQAEAQSLIPPYISVEKTAKSDTCEKAEISLKITGAGDPIKERKPIDVIFVIDRSKSMNMEEDYLAKVKLAVNDFIGQMDFTSIDSDRVGVVSYSGYSDNPSTIDYPLGSDGASATSSVNSIVAGGGTCIECGLQSAYDMLSSGEREQFVILLSDGVANVKSPGSYDGSNICNFTDPDTSLVNCPIVKSTCTENAVSVGTSIKEVRGATVYSIGYRLSDIDIPTGTCDNSGQTFVLAEQTLKEISSNPIGYYHSGNPDNISTVFNDIAYKINNIAGYDAKIVEVLPAGISYDSMISGNAPTLVSGQTITWEFGNISIGDIKEVKFLVTTTSSGHTGLVDVYPDTRVEYLDVYDQINTVPFPETSLTIDSCNPVIATSTISGYKYNDLNNNGLFDDEGEIVDDWGIELLTCTYSPLSSGSSQFMDDVVIDSNPDNTGSCIVFASTTTDSLGHYEFTDLLGGDYLVREVQDSLWQQTFPLDKQIYYFNLEEGVATTTINFANYYPSCGNGILDFSEECDDSNNDNGDGCSATCANEGGEDESYCGDGYINQTSEQCDDGNLVSGDGCDDNCQIEPYCGDETCDSNESCSTCSSDCGSCSSGGGGGTPLCILRGDCKSNYIPPVSEDAVEETSDAIEVLGEEGAPSLTITKSVNTEIANPGDILNYSVLVTNNGNLESFNTTLTDTLPAGFVFLENEEGSYTWNLGDIPAGESRDANYQVKVLETAIAGDYTNTAVAMADNNDDVSASTDVEVIIPVVLAETGMDFGELAFLLMFSIMSILVGRKLNLKSLA